LLEKSYVVRTIEGGGFSIVNVCDRELLGMVFEEGKAILNVSREYYGGEEVDEETVVSLMKSSSIISLIGERSVALAVNNKFGSLEAVKKVKSIPYLMVFRFRIGEEYGKEKGSKRRGVKRTRAPR